MATERSATTATTDSAAHEREGKKPKTSKKTGEFECNSCGKKFVYRARFLTHQANCGPSTGASSSGAPSSSQDKDIKELLKQVVKGQEQIIQAVKAWSWPQEGEGDEE